MHDHSFVDNFLPLALIIAAIATLYFRLHYFTDSPLAIRKSSAKYWFLRSLRPIYRPYLVCNFPFYNRLNDKDKILFEKRVQKFIDKKDFIPRGGIKKVTPEMKALVAGSAIQLTFGYPYIYFRHFYRILIYPDEYYSRITRKFHKGEVNLGGLIVVSWRSLKEGFSSHDDGHHLGLHEMAHALRLINIIENDEYDFYERGTMQLFDAEAKKEIDAMARNPEGEYFFRAYASSNLEEFFAVAVELFFERPKSLKRHNATLYSLLAKILKIDPIAKSHSRDMTK